MDFDHFIEGLKQRLELPLPGKEAQRLMAPYGTNEDRFDPVASSKARSGAVLILFYPGEGSIHFPLIRRSEYDGVHSGQIALPGGKREKSDEDLIGTATREAWEEIGVNPTNISVIGSLTELFIPVSNFRVLPVVAFSDSTPTFVADQQEVNEVIIADTSILAGRQDPLVTEIMIGEYRINAPYFALEDRVIWGATAMMLGELKAVIESLEGQYNAR